MCIVVDYGSTTCDLIAKSLCAVAVVVIGVICGVATGEIVGADVVEYNPLYDVGAVSGITGGAGVDRVGVTGEIAAKIARELAAVMLRSSNISNI